MMAAVISSSIMVRIAAGYVNLARSLKMLRIMGEGNKTHVKHEEGTLDTNIKVPSRREAIHMVGHLEFLVKNNGHSRLIDGEVITKEQCFDVIRRFILTR